MDFAFGAKDFVKAVADACCYGSGARVGEGCMREEWRNYVTHVVHLNGEGTPSVEREELAALGVDCVRIYGRKNGNGEGMIYDSGLMLALEAILGGPRRGEKEGTGLSRRNTLNVTS